MGEGRACFSALRIEIKEITLFFFYCYSMLIWSASGHFYRRTFFPALFRYGGVGELRRVFCLTAWPPDDHKPPIHTVSTIGFYSILLGVVRMVLDKWARIGHVQLSILDQLPIATTI